MKKLLFLLLVTISSYGQTLQNPTFGNTTTNTLKIKTPATVTSVNFLPAFDADGITISKIAPVNLGFMSSPYKSQTWGILGDSFTELNIFQPGLLSKLYITSISDGIGGSCITGGTGNAEGDGTYRTPFVDRIVSMLSNSITGIIIEGGSNDFHYNIPLGKYGSTNVNEFYGALNFICDKIANHPTKLKALFITPTFRGDAQHGGASSGLANWEAMKPYITAIKLVASKYSIQVVDEFGSGINYYNTDVYTTDGVHPNNANGTELYTNFLVSNINSGTLNVPTLDLSASYEVDPTFWRTIYFSKSGSDIFNDAGLVVTNQVDADFRIQVTAPGDSNKRVSIGSYRPNVNTILAEATGGKVGIRKTNPAVELDVNGDGYFTKRLAVANTKITDHWASYSNTLQIGQMVYQDYDILPQGTLGFNIYYNGTTQKRINTGGAVALVWGNDGSFAIRNDISRTSGSTNSTTERFKIDPSGTVNIPNLAGTGTRQVVADANGNFSATAPQPLKYLALLSQTGTGAPTATVLENTIGTIVWTRTGVGTYNGTLSGAFTANKTFVIVNASNTSTAGSAPIDIMGASASSASAIGLFKHTTALGVNSDAFTNVPIQILVYP